MKNKIMRLMVWLMLVGLMTPVTEGLTGTVMTGAKVWYAWWDSSILNWFEKDLASGFGENRLTLTATKGFGTGWLAGPMIGYQWGDGKWSCSFAAMGFSDFDQDWDGWAGSMKLYSSLELKRRDYDLAVNYAVNNHVKVYGGFKFQDMDMDFRLTYTAGTNTVLNQYHITSRVYIPTVGIGLAYPVLDQLAASGQLGVLYSIPDLSITNYTTQTATDIWTRPSLGFNTELTVNYQPLPALVIQLGYRYQVFSLETFSLRTEKKETAYDITHGPTLSAVYVF